ncbi:unnamed protein product, partial [Allacma fusca]
SSCRA